MALGTDVNGKYLVTKDCSDNKAENWWNENRHWLAHHDDAYLILCVYDQNDVNDKIADDD